MDTEAAGYGPDMLLLLALACTLDGPVTGSLNLSTGETLWWVDGMVFEHAGGQTLVATTVEGASCAEDPATWDQGHFHVLYALGGEDFDYCYVYEGRYAQGTGSWLMAEELPDCRVSLERQGELATGRVICDGVDQVEVDGAPHCGLDPWD